MFLNKPEKLRWFFLVLAISFHFHCCRVQWRYKACVTDQAPVDLRVSVGV